MSLALVRPQGNVRRFATGAFWRNAAAGRNAAATAALPICMSRKNVKSGQQGTDRPWQRPGQSSQDPSINPPQRKDREGRYAAPPADERNSPPAFTPPAGIKRVDRPTEDDLAQAALGGPKGSPEL